MINKLAFQIGPIRGIGPLGFQGEKGAVDALAKARFNSYLSGAIGLITVIASIWFIFNFIIGAISIIGSGGDKGKLEEARARITTGVIGIVIVIASLFIVQAIASLIGLGNIILKPTDIIDLIAQPSS